MDLTLKASRNNLTHKCPVSNLTYRGTCPNLSCPANLARITNNEKVGCYHVGRTASLSDFASLLNVDIKEAKTLYSSSITVLEKMVALYNKLAMLRKESKWRHHCLDCGAPLKANFSSCLNKIKCKEREKMVNKQKGRKPFSLPGLDMTKADVWLFVEHYDRGQIRKEFGVYFSETFWEILPATFNPTTGNNSMTRSKMSFTQLKKEDSESVYVINTSIEASPKKIGSNVAFTITYPGGQSRSITVYSSWVPQDLSEQTTKASLLDSHDFRQAISSGYITLVSVEDAEEILLDDDAQLEAARLRNRLQNVEASRPLDDKAPSTLPKQLTAEAESDDINPMLVDLCGREEGEIELVEVYSKLRNYESMMTIKEAEYVRKNLNSKLRDKKIEGLIDKKLKSKG